ncbi:hypothetical protein GQ53DRAFT_692225 [Thozetella sp. PMI_491]|nr:hypothetical protein GQ53DRAFT_692225 [Thozetella sp. PMI_491]
MLRDPSRSISPASKRPRPSPSDQSGVSSVRTTKINYPKKRVSVACEVCRTRKTRCDAAKPTCSFCSQLGIQCVYRRLEPSGRPIEELEELVPAPALQQDVLSRLECIEALLRQTRRESSQSNDLVASPQTIQNHLAAAVNSPKPSAAGSLIPDSPQRNRNRPLLFGVHLNGFSRLEGYPCPPELELLCTYDAEAQLECQLSHGDRFFADPPDGIGDLDLSTRRTWQLQQSFTADVLTYCPIIDQHDVAALLVRCVESNFKQANLETALALLMLALGDFARQRHHIGGDPSTLPGISYFRAGRQIVDAGKRWDNSILFVQCQILTAFYLFYALSPHLAYEAINLASSRIMVLLALGKRLAADSILREQCHRAYWACYLIEHELQSHVPYSSQVLQNIHDGVPLPLSNYEEPGMYWFLSEIALRGIFSNWRNGEAWTFFTMYAPVIVNEISAQMFEWHSNLAGPIAFPLETPNLSTRLEDSVVVLKPLLDPHKVFLRAQFYALQTVVHWSSVVQLMSMSPVTATSIEHTRVVTSAAQSLHYGIYHIHAVESLLYDRHLMLMANITGLCCITMLLACTYNAPALAAIQHPQTATSLKIALRCLKKWRHSPGMEDKIQKAEGLMVLRGIDCSDIT